VIDIPTLVRNWMPQAQQALNGRLGVYEVHFCDDEQSDQGPTPLWRFVQDWGLEDCCRITPEMHRQQFIGVVGDGCAVLYRIDRQEGVHRERQRTL